MNKAFTKEDDDGPEPAPPRLPPPVPPGVKNYLTPEGARKLREELQRLQAAAAAPLVDQRIDYLRQSLQSAEIVPAPIEPPTQVRFGTTVMVRNEHGEESRYRLVGVDEIEIDRGYISWRSPLAAALLKARVGDRVRFRSPMGEEVLRVVAIG